MTKYETKIMKQYLFIFAAALVMCTASLSAEAQDKQEKGYLQAIVSATDGTVGFNDRITANISVGWRFNRGNYLGIGSGLHWDRQYYGTSYGPAQHTPWLKSIPLYLDYIHYFNFKNCPWISIYLGQEIGGSYFLDMHEGADPERFGYLRPYTNTKCGFDIGFNKYVGLDLGLGLITIPQAWQTTVIGPSIGLRF